MKLYLVAGEASGDARGAELLRALRERDPALEFSGAGGREMRTLAGGDFVDWADEAVVGLWDVLFRSAANNGKVSSFAIPPRSTSPSWPSLEYGSSATSVMTIKVGKANFNARTVR